MSRSTTTSPASVEVLVDGFVGYLREERGVSALTVEAYVPEVRRFLACRGDASSLHELTAAEISQAVLGEVAGRSPATVRRYGCALRAFLRYGHLAGLVETDLSAAVLPVAGRRRSLLPQGITEAQARALLRGCDRRRAVGRRDYAVIVLMLRLGLRAHEVATLRLEDIDWRAGQVTVHGKRARVDQLPLPADVGKVIAGYLQRGRPCHHRAGGICANGPAAGGAEPQCRVDYRPARLHAGRAGAVRCPPAAAHRRLPDAARRRVAGRDRSGPAAPLGRCHGCLCPGGCRTAPDVGAALADRSGIMSALAEQVEDYLRLRCALGFKLGLYRERLSSFLAYLDGAGASTVTVELALAWAWLPAGIKPITASFRLSMVRGFARYLHAIDPANEVPPPGLLAVPRRRPAPYLYSPNEIARVLEMTRLLRPPLRAATHTTLLGLLASCGMRLGEAQALTGDDVNLDAGVLTIRHAKFDRMRLVPLHRRSPPRCATTPRSAISSAPCRAPTGSSSRPPRAR